MRITNLAKAQTLLIYKIQCQLQQIKNLEQACFNHKCEIKSHQRVITKLQKVNKNLKEQLTEEATEERQKQFWLKRGK